MSPVRVDEYEKIEAISHGSYADIYKVSAKGFTEDHGSRTAVDFNCAAKFIKLPVQQQNKKGPDLQQLVDENKNLCSLKHKNLVELIDMKAIYAESSIAMFMELFEGQDLDSRIKSSGALDEAVIKVISIQICTALEYLHSNNVIHRNINSGTVMITEDNVVKLVDFGLSIQLLDATSHHSVGQPRGLPQYMAPEVFLVEETEKSEYGCIYSRGSDIWAIGCVVCEMAAGKKPYAECRNMLAIVHQVKEGSQPDIPAQCSGALKDFYASCMAKDRRERMPVTDLLQHDFLRQGTEPTSPKPGSSSQPQEKCKQKYATEGLNGMCLVISSDSHEWSGSTIPTNTKQDAEQIENVFKSLGFEVKVLKDPDSNKLWNFLHNIATNQVTTKCGCLICFILAPGENGVIISKEGSEIGIGDVVGRFLSTQCPNLKAKPKLFVVQTERSTMVQTNAEDDFSFRLREKDFLVCNVARGVTSFVKILCNVLESAQFKDRDVETILGEVTKRLSIDAPIRREQRFCTSSPEIVSSLTMMCSLIFSSSTSALCTTLPKYWSDEQLLAQINLLTETNTRFGPMKQTLLMIAAIRGRADLVKKLLEHVPRDVVAAQDVRGRTALFWAAHKGHEGVLAEFEKAFESDAESLKSEVNRADFVKQTPIILAAKRHRPLTVIDQLKRMGANLDVVDTIKFSAVTYAASQGFADTVEKLLELKASAKLLDFLGNSPLIWAARNGHDDVVNVLGEFLNDSSDVSHWSLIGERGMGAKQWAEHQGHLELAGHIDEMYVLK